MIFTSAWFDANPVVTVDCTSQSGRGWRGNKGPFTTKAREMPSLSRDPEREETQRMTRSGPIFQERDTGALQLSAEGNHALPPPEISVSFCQKTMCCPRPHFCPPAVWGYGGSFQENRFRLAALRRLCNSMRTAGERTSLCFRDVLAGK